MAATDPAGPELVRSDDMVHRTIAGEGVLVPLRTARGRMEHIYSLSETGAFLWDALAEPATADSLAARLVDTYQVSEDTARRDVQRFVDDLLEVGAVRPVESRA